MAETRPVSGAARFDVRTTSDSHFSWLRTRMSLERTLMSWMRTGIALIGFGFTIFQFFQRLREQDVIKKAASARNFGLTLVALGVVMLILGIVYHVMFMLGLRRVRDNMRAESLVHGESGFPTSLVLIVAIILLLIGVAAALSMVARVGPFGE